jgi:two-component system, NarL family, response regulator DegU
MIMTIEPKKILILDDSEIYTEALKLSLGFLFKNVDLKSINKGESLTKDLIEKFDPDIIISDISMNGIGGLKAIENIRNANIKTPVLMLSMHDRKEYLEQSIKLKANGFLLKDTGINKLNKVISLLLSGENYFTESNFR